MQIYYSHSWLWLKDDDVHTFIKLSMDCKFQHQIAFSKFTHSFPLCFSMRCASAHANKWLGRWISGWEIANCFYTVYLIFGQVSPIKLLTKWVLVFILNDEQPSTSAQSKWMGMYAPSTFFLQNFISIQSTNSVRMQKIYQHLSAELEWLDFSV